MIKKGDAIWVRSLCTNKVYNSRTLPVDSTVQIKYSNLTKEIACAHLCKHCGILSVKYKFKSK